MLNRALGTMIKWIDLHDGEIIESEGEEPPDYFVSPKRYDEVTIEDLIVALQEARDNEWRWGEE